MFDLIGIILILFGILGLLGLIETDIVVEIILIALGLLALAWGRGLIRRP